MVDSKIMSRPSLSTTALGLAAQKPQNRRNPRALAVDDAVGAPQALALTKEAADAANHEKSQFLANMSHELRTPLRPNRRRSGRCHPRLLILDLSRIELGQLEIHDEQVDRAECVDECVRVLDGKTGHADFNILVPGHGRIADKGAAAAYREYKTALRAAVKAQIDAGKSLDEIKDIVKMEDYKSWGGYERMFALNVEGMYRHLMGQ